jgi:hypothetical protein
MFGVEYQGSLEDWRNVTFQSNPKQFSTIANVGVMDNPRFRQEFDCVLNTFRRIAMFVHDYPAKVNGYDDQIAYAISQINAENAAKDAEAMKQAAAAEAAASADAAVSKVAEEDAAAAAGTGLKRTRDSGVGGRGGAAKRARGRPRKGA